MKNKQVRKLSYRNTINSKKKKKKVTQIISLFDFGSQGL